MKKEITISNETRPHLASELTCVSKSAKESGHMKLDLYFEGLMMSWRGAEIGKTGNVPPKSAIVGMIGRAMGIDYEDTAELKEVADSFEIDDIFTFENYDFYKAPQKLPIITFERMVDDQINSRTGVKKQKEYLVDAKIGVTIKGTEEALTEIRKAFLHPIWPVYLGSSCCVPAGPIIRGNVY